MAGYLSTLDAIKSSLAKAVSVFAVKEIRDKAVALATYHKQVGDCKEVERQATIIRLRAERRIGEILAKSVRAGSPKCSPGAQLPAGITRKQSSNWQLVAKVPEKEFEKYIAGHGQLSTKALVGIAYRHQRASYRRGPETGCGIITGDMAVLSKKLDDNSVSLFLTDPPYADVEAYSNLAQLAKSKLRNGGLCVAYSGSYYLPQILNLMGEHLDYWWCFALPLGGQHSRINSRRVFQAWKPILAFSKGKVEREWIVDCLQGPGKEKTLHAWQQAESESEYLISKLSNKGELVVDPYTGSGTTLAVAKKLGRRYLGAEIDASVARGARARLAA